MALPIGHAVVGVATAAVVARATGTPGSPELWIGAVVASGVPDLDMIAYVLGYRSPKYHRNATHSLLVMAAMVAVGWLVLQALPVTLEAGVAWAWVAAFFSHPFLDIVTTGPSTAARGYGIPLFWPLSTKRFYTTSPIMETLDIQAVRLGARVLGRVAPRGLPSRGGVGGRAAPGGAGLVRRLAAALLGERDPGPDRLGE